MFEKIRGKMTGRSKEEVKKEDKEKAYKKEVYEKEKHTRAKKRRERFQEWKKMSKEERKEKYGKRYERAKELYDLEKSRMETAKLEAELENKNKIFSKIWSKIPFTGKKSVEELKKEYNEKLEEYQNKKAETISDHVQGQINQMKRTEDQASLEKMERAKWEKIKKGWKWLGDQNMEKVLKKFGKEPKSKWGKMFARIASLRSATTLGLMGVGWVGAGALGGSAAYGTRRLIGGAGATFGIYDFMNVKKEIEDFTFSEDEVKAMNEEELEEKVAAFISRGKTNGENYQYDKNYKMIEAEYRKRVKEKSDTTNALLKLDDAFRKKDEEIQKEIKKRKKVAVGLGVITGGALAYSKISELIENSSEISEAFESLLGKVNDKYDSVAEWFAEDPEEAVKETKEKIKHTPCMNEETLNEVVQDETARKEAKVNMIDNGEIPADSSETSPESLVDSEKMETVDSKAIGTIDKGSNVWDAAQKMIEDGNITKEEFWEAWDNKNSTVELPSGREVHISKLDLTHPGDQVVFVPGEDGGTAHFEVKNLAEEYDFGSSQDLYDTYKELGKEIPEWLDEAAKWDVTLDEIGVTSNEYTTMIEDINLTNYEAESAAQEMKSIFNLTENIDKPLSEITFKEFKDVADSAGINMTYDRSQLYIDFLQTLNKSEILNYQDLSDIAPEDIKDMDFGGSEEIKKTVKDLANIETVQETTKDITGLTQETIQEAGEALKEKGIEVESFDNAEFNEGATSEDVSNSLESWNEAIKQAQEAGMEIDNAATAVEISEGTFKIPPEGKFGELIVKFTEGMDGSIKGFTYQADTMMDYQIMDSALKDNFRGIVRETAGESYKNFYPDVVQNLARNIEVQERVLDALEPGSKEFNYIKEAIEAKMNQIKQYGDVLK